MKILGLHNKPCINYSLLLRIDAYMWWSGSEQKQNILSNLNLSNNRLLSCLFTSIVLLSFAQRIFRWLFENSHHHQCNSNQRKTNQPYRRDGAFFFSSRERLCFDFPKNSCLMRSNKNAKVVKSFNELNIFLI